MIDARGVPLSIATAGANRHDSKLVERTLNGIEIGRPRPTADQPQGICLDKGYDFDIVRDLVAGLGFTAHIRARGEEARAIKTEVGFKARRWVVERTHSWMNRFRSLLIRWTKKGENYLGLLHLACAYITFAQAGFLG